MIFYYFKVEINQEGCLTRLKLAYGNETPSRAIVFICFTEFRKGRNSLLGEEHKEDLYRLYTHKRRQKRKMLMDDNSCTYQMIQKKFDIGSAAIHTIVIEEMHIKMFDFGSSKI